MRASTRIFVSAGLLFALALALFVSPFASSKPDGLQRVAADEGFADTATNSATASGPLAGYAVDGDEGGRSTAVSGVVGILVTFGIGTALFGVLRVLREDDEPDPNWVG